MSPMSVEIMLHLRNSNQSVSVRLCFAVGCSFELVCCSTEAIRSYPVNYQTLLVLAPRITALTITASESFAEHVGSDLLSSDGSVLRCRACEREIVAEGKSQVAQHLSGSKHKSKFERQEQSTSSSVVQMALFLGESSKQHQFSLRRCNAFLAADIPLHKLDNVEVKKIFEAGMACFRRK